MKWCFCGFDHDVQMLHLPGLADFGSASIGPGRGYRHQRIMLGKNDQVPSGCLQPYGPDDC